MQKKFIRNDFILIAVIVLVAIISFLIFKLTQKSGMGITVNIDGKTVAEYALDKDLKKDIVTDYGKNVLVIKNGKAYILEADCPDKICVGHKAISKTGESIVCLPHKLVVTVSEE